MAKVVVLKTNQKNVIKDYKRLMYLSNYKKFIPKNRGLLLKLNLSWSLYYPACSTEPWQLEGVLKTLVEDGYKEIYPVENKTVVTNVWKGARLNKWLPLLKKYNQKYFPLTEAEWISYKPKHEMLALNDLFEDFKIPKMFLGKDILHLPTMKTHGHTIITGAIKNAFGGLITKRRHHSHKYIHEILVDLLQIQKEIHPGIFAVMDGTVCGDGAGPRTMDVKIKDYILASNDQVAIDSIAAKMMGFDPMKIGFIKIAHEKGLGCGDLEQIDIIGEDISRINFGFKTKKSLVILMDQVLRRKYPIFESLLFHTPLFWSCIFGSYIYHDYFWYPLIGKKKINDFMKTKWGVLFKKY